MAMVSSFDQWQNDVFFSAAEEVQESADKLESIYRMWLRHPSSDGSQSDISDEFFGELRTALGTAKWQMEEFERAIGLSYEDIPAERYRVTRHREFVQAIGNQISHIEKAVNDSLEKNKQPFSWVQLDAEERDDLAIFLSVPLQASRETKSGYIGCDSGPIQVKTKPISAKGFKETVTINKDSRYVVEVAEKEPCNSKDSVVLQEEQSDGYRRTWSSSDIGAWKIVIADEEDAERKMVESKLKATHHASGHCGFLRSIVSVAKSKFSRNSLPKAKSGKDLQVRRGLSNYLELKGVSRFTQQGINGLSERSRNCFSSCSEDTKIPNVQHLVGKAGGLHRHIQSSQNYMQFGRSLRIIILLLLTMILIVPFWSSCTTPPKLISNFYVFALLKGMESPYARSSEITCYWALCILSLLSILQQGLCFVLLAKKIFSRSCQKRALRRG